MDRPRNRIDKEGMNSDREWHHPGHLPGENTLVKHGNKQSLDTTQQMCFVSPNTHLVITVIFIATLVAFSFLVFTDLDRVKSDCQKKGVWISGFESAYKRPEYLNEYLQTLQDLHSYMKENNIAFPMVQKQISGLNTEVDSLLTWKRQTTDDIKSLKTDVKEVSEILTEHKHNTEEFRRKTGRETADLYDEVKELRNELSIGTSDTDILKEEISTVFNNLLHVDRNISTLRVETRHAFLKHGYCINHNDADTRPEMETGTKRNLHILTEPFDRYTEKDSQYEPSLAKCKNDIQTIINNLKSHKAKGGESKKITGCQKQTFPGDSAVINITYSTRLQSDTLPKMRCEINSTQVNFTETVEKNILKAHEKLSHDCSTLANRYKKLEIRINKNRKVTYNRLGEHGNLIKQIERDLLTLTDGISTLKHGVTSLERKTDKIVKETGRQKQNIETLKNNVSDYKRNTDETLSLQGGQIKHMVHKELSALQKAVHDVTHKADSVRNLAVENQQALGVHKAWAESQQSEFEVNRKDMDDKHGDTVFKQSVLQEVVDGMRQKMVIHDISFWMGLLAGIGCCVLMFMNMNSKGSKQTSEVNTMAGKQLRSRGNKDIYSLTWNEPVESSLCVVTFHSETEKKHIEETRSVFESFGATLPVIHTRVIRRHSDIQELPRSRVFLVFVDFNERNVILENPEKGLGDLRVTTVRSLWEFGGDVTVIYCRDLGSRKLDGDLFNRDLASIYRHPELSQLKKQNRMLSIFDGFSDVQKQHCRDFINRQLGTA